MTTPHRLASACLLVLLLGFAARPADLVTLAGKKTTGDLVHVDGQFVGFRDATGIDVKVPVKEVAAVELGHKVFVQPKETRYDEAELTDGSVIRGTQFRIKGKKVEVAFLPVSMGVVPPVVDVPLGTLFWVMRGADDPRNHGEWKKLLAGRGKRDLFVVRQAEGLNPLQGTVLEGNEAGDRLSFEKEDGQKANLPLSRATGGLVFNQPPKDVIPPTVCKVVDVFGNVWFATAVEVTGPGLKVRTVAGATVEYASLEGVSKLDFSQGNLSYLSDLEAVVAYPPPEKDGPLGEQYPFAPQIQKDRGLGAAEIVLHGKAYPRGLSVPADTTLTYKLDGNYREFKTVAGILDAVKPDDSSLKLKIEVDGRVVFAETIAKKNKPREINLNVKDAKDLKISVERDALFAGNQLNLADARVQK